MPQTRPLSALVVDGETSARAEVTRLLGEDPRIGEIRTATTVAEALDVLGDRTIDVVFCDVKAPELAGRDLARTLARFASSARVVVATAREADVVRTFEVRVTDCARVLQRLGCLEATVRRVVEDVADTASPGGRGNGAGNGTGIGAGHGTGNGTAARDGTGDDGSRGSAPAASPGGDDETIAVELAGVTRFVRRSQVRFVEAHGDYARLHTATGSHLVRIPLSALEERWADAGFVRIHRSTLVALPHVDEIRTDGGRCAVRLGDRILQVSRRHTKALRDRLVRAASLTRDRHRTG